MHKCEYNEYYHIIPEYGILEIIGRTSELHDSRDQFNGDDIYLYQKLIKTYASIGYAFILEYMITL